LVSLEELQRIRKYAGEPSAFWSTYVDLLSRATEADAALIAFHDRQKRRGWRVLASTHGAGADQEELRHLAEAVQEHADLCREHGHHWPDRNRVLLVDLDAGSETEHCIAAFSFGSLSRAVASDVERLVRSVADVPASYQLQRVARDASIRLEQFATVLDLTALVNQQDRFLATAMVLCNEVAHRMGCERVSLGWLEKGYVRVKAISHVDRFDKKTEAVTTLERVMEETIDQDTEIVYPAGGRVITRDHEEYARSQDVANLCSLPLRVEDEPAAVLTCERASSPFSENDIRLLRLICDQSARRLGDLKARDRWFGARAAASARKALGKLLGYEHTWAKILGLLLAVGLGVLIFGTMGYKVKSSVILRTDDVAFLTAPYDGHIFEVHAKVGDEVAAGDALLHLDETDMRLQEAALIAERNRYRREFEKSRAQNSLADMRINQALQEQVTARLEMLRHELRQSVVRAPFDAIVVEGDQSERIGAPVQKGDTLFKLAHVDDVYVEIEVAESDVHEVTVGQQGEIALASRPQRTFGVRVTKIEPVAQTKEEGNVFIARAEFPAKAPGWWRPGMTGVSKLHAGRRSILWVLTHRTVDFLRLRLFW
jgi:hypothetical protein